MAGIGLTPNSSIWFHRVPWDNSYKHVVKFTDMDAQIAYFQSAEQYSMSFNCTFQTIELRMEIRADIPIDDVLELRSNYVTFSNYRYDVGNQTPKNKRHYYGFLHGVRYASFNSCFLDVELDVYQTFLFDFNLPPCFVKREHIVSDTLGANTVEESLDTGKLKVYGVYEKESINNLGILANATRAAEDPPYTGQLYSGIANGLMYYYWPSTDLNIFPHWLRERNSTQAGMEGIKTISMLPDEFTVYDPAGDIGGGPNSWRLPWSWEEFCGVTQGIRGNFSHEGQTAIDFTPRGESSGNIGLFAPTSGTVITGDDGTTGRGKYVQIVTPDGYRITMAHFNSLASLTGSVSTGDYLGEMGTTGNSTGVHLHFEVQDDASGAASQLSDLFARPISFWYYPSTENSLLQGEISSSGPGMPNAPVFEGSYFIIEPTNDAVKVQYGIPKMLGAMDGYEPKNIKLKTFPYNYIVASNNQGQVKEWRYELMDSGVTNQVVNFSCEISASPTLFITPLNYNGAEENYDEGIRLSGFPQVPAQYGAYEAWVAQQGASNMLGAALSVASIGVGIAGKSMQAVASGVSGLTGLLGQYLDAKAKPDTAIGNATGTGLAAQNKLNATFFLVGLRYEHARRIDSYFEKFGYATNELKQPNQDSRPYWNYVECADAAVQGNMPRVFVQKLNDMFNKGVTIWKQPENLGNYSLNNH